MHLVGFIIRIHHDARSPERQKKKKKDLSVVKYIAEVLNIITY